MAAGYLSTSARVSGQNPPEFPDITVDAALFVHLRDHLPGPAHGAVVATATHLRIQLPSEVSGEIKVLMLIANPMDTGRIDLYEEARSIEGSIRGARLRHRFSFAPQPAARIGDLPRLLREHRPAVIHFSGHGVNQGLIMANSAGFTSVLSADSLAELLKAAEHRPRMVVLNACYSDEHATALSLHSDAVVGMRGAVDDNAARQFSTTFYERLADGDELRVSFNLACAMIGAERLPGADAPQLVVDTEATLASALVRG